MKEFWSSMIKDIEPYTPGEQPKNQKFIKLNTNENPYPPSPGVIEAIRQGVGAQLRLYPDPSAGAFVEAVAEYWGVDTAMVFPGNGSDEVLAMAFMAFFEEGREVAFPDVTYSFYPVYSNLFGQKIKIVKLKEDYSIDVDGMRGDGGVVLANPNAPTGMALSLPEVERIVRQNPAVVVLVDEAYVSFGAESAVSLVGKYENLLVCNTLSKSHSLAGMRLGYAIGAENLIAGLNAVKDSFNSYTLDRLAILAGAAAMRDRAYTEETSRKIVATRERAAAALREKSFTVLPSKANFFYVKPPFKQAEEVFKELREKGILIRRFGGERERDYLRVSIGTDEEMDAFLTAIFSICGV